MMMKSPDTCRWLLFPGSQSWELWRVSDRGAQRTRELSAAEARGWSAGGGAAVMPSVASWVTVPMQVPGGAGDDESLREMAALRLEGDGIIEDAEADGVELFSVNPMPKSEVAVISALTRDGVDWVDSLAVTPSCVVSPTEALIYQPDAITLRRELGSWVMVVTVGAAPVYYQRCGSGEFAAVNGARELSGVLMSLRMAGVDGVRFLKSLVIEVGADEREEYESVMAPIAEALGLACKLTDERSLEASFSVAGLPALATPGMAAEAQSRLMRKRLAGIGAVAAVAWLGVLGFTVFSVYALRADADAAEEAAAVNAPEVQALKEAESKIRGVDFVLSEQAFPPYVLLQVDALKPAATVRFTDFRLDAARNLSIKGTAARPDEAIRFGENLRASRQFVDYEWETPNPTNTRDNTATFSFKGTYTIPVTDAEPAPQI
ncbi:hypothetical protein [Sulfuriroseicoccus oceanibius]|uniref:Fimbrial assembly family protein n=1 Tax=Sulfuriroseicoccus oceanibius TaxID=2707525 RepID=A0A6B3L584_9BACT|nr:hypothetical protein [Sulfuriroseicoccus oceanibius]QQL44813.1 hypothetical protein G3M56_013175 [Sulfuriroseicoccus oceanibius]